MTKHTDTSRIADLRFQVSEKMPINHSDLSCLFDRIEAQAAEIERLREALKFYADGWDFYAFGGSPSVALTNDEGDIARAALGDTQ